MELEIIYPSWMIKVVKKKKETSVVKDNKEELVTLKVFKILFDSRLYTPQFFFVLKQIALDCLLVVAHAE